jgi:dCTP deaminase
MLLGKPRIQYYMETGDIIIDPFVPENLGSAQYDVTIGENVFREVSHLGSLYNPFDEKHVRRKWELDKAISHEEWVERSGQPLVNVALDEKLIIVGPGETILGHTQEFIGGACNFITTMMKARSSMGRNFFEVCKCAGMGDAGYFNRWTMEITNNSRYHQIPIVVGRRVAQLLFFKIDPVDDKDVYDQAGKYQTTKSLAELKASWLPEQMLPRQWRDRECKNAGGIRPVVPAAGIERYCCHCDEINPGVHPCPVTGDGLHSVRERKVVL